MERGANPRRGGAEASSGQSCTHPGRWPPARRSPFSVLFALAGPMGLALRTGHVADERARPRADALGGSGCHSPETASSRECYQTSNARSHRMR